MRIMSSSAEVAAGLDFDQFEINLARILEAVLGADGNVGRLVLVHDLGLLAKGHSGGAAQDPATAAQAYCALRRGKMAMHDGRSDDQMPATAPIVAPKASSYANRILRNTGSERLATLLQID
jgi:hypothetical protein